MPPKADSAKRSLTFVNVTDPRQMRTSTLRRTVRSKAAVTGHDRRRKQLAQETEASSANTQSIADEEQQWHAELDQQNERAFAVASAVLTRATQPNLRWTRCSGDTTTDQSTSTADHHRTVQHLMQPRPTQETAMSGYVGITDPRSYRLMNMRESLRHHPAHAVWLSYHAIVATSLPNSEPPGSFVGKTITVGGGSGRPHIETQSANGNGSSSKQQTERRREVETPTSINAETLADHVQDGSDSATTTLVRVATGFQEAIRESGFTKALSQEVAAAKESQKGLYHVGSGWTQPKQLRQQLRTV